MRVRRLLASFSILLLLCAALLCACAEKELVDMESDSRDGLRLVLWEGRVYVPFCVVSLRGRGEQIGYVDGDTADRISEYDGYPPEEWLVSWVEHDGGAMLLKEETVTDIPEGLAQEYGLP